jgi:hypothetical protein
VVLSIFGGPRIWLQAGEEPSERARHTVQDETVTITVAWSVDGFHVVDELPKGMKFNADYYMAHVFEPLVASAANMPTKKLIIHADVDNGPVQVAKQCQEMMEQTGLERAPHTPYSPDFAPSAFFLFGYVKGKLKGIDSMRENRNRQDIMNNIEDILTSIRPEVLRSGFAEWTDRLRWVIQHKGDYDRKGKEENH